MTIIAHSMGGLVVRQYHHLFGSGDIDKIITLGTPHKGIVGTTKNTCTLFGASKECEDMAKGSVFLNRLSQTSLDDVSFHAIRATGCAMGDTMGDSIVTEENGFLDGAQNYLINGTCTGALETGLHSDILNADLYPQVFELVVDILQE
mgnify:CR=1 FL=1